MEFDFRKYHVRSINAASEQERATINQELKDLYATLNDTEKEEFNRQLQSFLVQQYKNLGNDYNALKKGGAFN